MLLISCKSSEEISPEYNDKSYSLAAKISENDTQLFGLWKMQSYADLKETPYDISLEFKNEKRDDGRFILSGKGPINFYFGSFEINHSESKIKFSTIGGTKIAGSALEMTYETTYFNKLASAEKIGLSTDGKTLILYLPEDTKDKIIYKLVSL